MSTWIVVLSWNGRQDTLDLLAGLTREPATVLVVDNGSRDGTLETVARTYPEVRTLQTGVNLGYTGGNNEGIRYALAHGAEVIGVLNNDTVVTEGFLTPLLDALDTYAPAAVSPDIRYESDPGTSWFRGSFLDARTGWPQHLAADRQPPADGPPAPTPVLTGCCIVARAETWRRVGLFDDRYFLMFEDSDWSRRAAAAGVALLVVPASRIRHRVSRSFVGVGGLLGNYYYARNGVVFARRHLGRAAAARFAWRQVLRPSARRVLSSDRRPEGTLAVLGLFAAIGSRGGPAGRVASRYATRRRE